MCISLSTWIAPPVECSATIVHRRHNTITLLCEKQNIMLSSVVHYLELLRFKMLAEIEISSVDFQSRLLAMSQCERGEAVIFSLGGFSYGRLRRSGRHRTRRDIEYCASPRHTI